MTIPPEAVDEALRAGLAAATDNIAETFLTGDDWAHSEVGLLYRREEPSTGDGRLLHLGIMFIDMPGTHTLPIDDAIEAFTHTLHHGRRDDWVAKIHRSLSGEDLFALVIAAQGVTPDPGPLPADFLAVTAVSTTGDMATVWHVRGHPHLTGRIAGPLSLCGQTVPLANPIANLLDAITDRLYAHAMPGDTDA